jgi:hypothetical protein
MSYNPLDLFTGETNDHVAHVYARLPGTAPIQGYVRGPFNAHTATLPATTPIIDLGEGEPRLGRAVVAHPCTWSPECPATYHVHIDGPQGTTFEHDCFGIRRFGARAQSFYLDGKRWVVRGIFDEGHTSDPEDWRAIGAARVLRSISAIPGQHEILAEATRRGVMVIVRLGDKTTSFPLQTIASYVCSPIVVLPEDACLMHDHRQAAPNLVFAQRLEHRAGAAEWADAIWLEFTRIEDFQGRIDRIELPIIAVRRGTFSSLAEARAAIDQLQADLAPIGQFAGYVV